MYKYKLGIIGAGNMAQALAKGLPVNEVMAEILAKKPGVPHRKQIRDDP